MGVITEAIEDAQDGSGNGQASPSDAASDVLAADPFTQDWEIDYEDSPISLDSVQTILSLVFLIDQLTN